jgi:hypothetical protein
MRKNAIENLRKKLDDAVIDYDDTLFTQAIHDFSFIKKVHGSECGKQVHSLLMNMHHYPQDFVAHFNDMMEYVKRHNIKPPHWLYNAELLTYKFNRDITYCQEYVDKLKKNKCTSKDGFIKRHGKEAGEKKFKKFQKTSVKWIDEYREKYGSDALIEKYKKSSKWCVEHYIDLGYSEVEASQLVSEFQLNNAGVNRQYYVSRGYTEDEIDGIMNSINPTKGLRKEDYITKHGHVNWVGRREGYRKGNTVEHFMMRFNDWEDKWKDRRALFVSNGEDFYKAKYGDDWETEYRKRLTQFSLAHNSLKLLDSYEVDSYMSEVQKHTQLSIINHSDKIPNFDKHKVSGYHLDHVYSKKQGFLDDIDPAIIGHYTNLAFVDSSYNMSKGAKCDKTKEKLLEDYKHGEKINYENIQNRSD